MPFSFKCHLRTTTAIILTLLNLTFTSLLFSLSFVYNHSTTFTLGDDDFFSSSLKHSHANRIPVINQAQSYTKVFDPSTKHLERTPSFKDRIAKSCRYKVGEGNEGRGGHKVLQKVRQGILKQEALNLKVKGTSNRNPRILCMVYTHSNNQEQIEAIANTWAQKCDGFFASSNAEKKALGILNLHHEGEESYENMWQKVRTMLFYAYETFINSYDYFHMYVNNEIHDFDLTSTYSQKPMFFFKLLCH